MSPRGQFLVLFGVPSELKQEYINLRLDPNLDALVAFRMRCLNSFGGSPKSPFGGPPKGGFGDLSEKSQFYTTAFTKICTFWSDPGNPLLEVLQKGFWRPSTISSSWASTALESLDSESAFGAQISHPQP